jgi:hypothetical protein
MSKVFEENFNLFTLLAFLRNEFDETYSDLERLCNYHVSRKTISKYLNDKKLVLTSNYHYSLLMSKLINFNDFYAHYEADDIQQFALLLIGNNKNTVEFENSLKWFLSTINPKENEFDEFDEDMPTVAINDESDVNEDDFDYVITPQNITLINGGETRMLSVSNRNFENVKRLVLEGNYTDAWTEANLRESIIKVTKGNVTIEGNSITFKGIPLRNSMADRVLELIKGDGKKYIEHLTAFVDKCMENPSFNSVNQLLTFLEKNTLPITRDGDFLTYKKVRHNYLDHYSGTVLNAPYITLTSDQLSQMPMDCNGVIVDVVDNITTVSMSRNAVDDNFEQTCSYGLHVCSYDYLSCFGHNSKILICKVNPKDVVSVPRDYNNQKMRCCEYQVIGEIDDGDQITDMFID